MTGVQPEEPLRPGQPLLQFADGESGATRGQEGGRRNVTLGLLQNFRFHGPVFVYGFDDQVGILEAGPGVSNRDGGDAVGQVLGGQQPAVDGPLKLSVQPFAGLFGRRGIALLNGDGAAAEGRPLGQGDADRAAADNADPADRLGGRVLGLGRRLNEDAQIGGRMPRLRPSRKRKRRLFV